MSPARLVLYVVLFLVLASSWGFSCVLWRAAGLNARVGPLEPRHFDSLTLVLVGTGGAYEDPERRGPATAIGFGEHIVLVDAGRGVADGLRAAAIPVAQPEAVLLTNLMPENTMGLDDLLFTGWLRDRQTPVRIYGPAGTVAFVSSLEAAYRGAAEARGDSLGLPSEGGRLRAFDVEDGFSETWGGLQIRAGALGGGPLPALAWRFERLGRSAVVSGTGWDDRALEAFATGADMLVHEGVYIPTAEDIEQGGVIADAERLAREGALHTSIMDVGDLASHAGVATLVLVRLRPPPFFRLQLTSLVSDSYSGSVVIPDDGDELVP